MKLGSVWLISLVTEELATSSHNVSVLRYSEEYILGTVPHGPLLDIVILLFTINIESLPTDKQNRKLRRAVKDDVRKPSQYPPKNPYDTVARSTPKYNVKVEPLEAFEPLDLTSEEEVAIKESIDIVKRYQLDLTANLTTKETRKPFQEKYGTMPPPKSKTKPKFKDFLEKYQPTTVWEQIDKEKIITGRNISRREEILSIVNGIDNTDELLSLPVENGKPKLPVQINGRRFRAGKQNEQGNMVQFNYMHIHQYMIELMKQAIYQARNRMTFMQDLRKKHRGSGLYKMGFLFAKADQAGKVFSSVSQKAYRMCNMIRQGMQGVYRPFLHYLDIVYAIERMETKWFDVDLLSEMIVTNDNIVKNLIFTNKTLKSPRDLAKAFDRMFIE